MKDTLFPLMIALLLSLPSCELPDNRDPKSPLEVPVESIFLNALRDCIAHIDNMNQNVNVTRLLCQYTSQVQFPRVSMYDFERQQIPDGYWNESYRILLDLQEVKRIHSEQLANGNAYNSMRIANKNAIVDILEVLLYHNLVDLFGDVPYTEALAGYENPKPVYDEARIIYYDLLSRLTDDIETLAQGIDASGWGGEDVVYGGNVRMWKKYAATLMLRLGMRLAEIDPLKTQSLVSEAIAAGCLEKGEAMQLLWLGTPPHVNTIFDLYIIGNRHDFVPSATIIDMMNRLDDSRIPAYFSPVDTNIYGTEPLLYSGLIYGVAQGNGYMAFSHFSDPMFAPDYPATNSCYAEVEFLIAEAASRGMTTDGRSAKDHYLAAIAITFGAWNWLLPILIILMWPGMKLEPGSK